MYTDHAPLGEVAFRAEPWNLLNSAVDIWALSTQVDSELAAQMMETAQWYEGFALTMDEIRNLPEEQSNDELVKRIQRYT